MGLQAAIGTALAAYLVALTAYLQGISDGSAAARRAAYDTRNPTDELEMACVGLWVGEQNRKYWEKEKGR